MGEKVSIIIPTYNEAENIGVLLAKLSKILESKDLDYEIIVVDDNSPDGTCNIVKRISHSNPRVKCVLRTKERGLSSAVVEGFRRASGDILVVMDADLQHPPEVVPKLVEAVNNGYDVAVASRYTEGGGVAGWSRIRLLMSKVGTLGVRALIRESRRTSDPLAGFFAVKRSSIDLGRLRPKGFKILLEILARHPNLSVVDVPYVFQRRLKGESKLGFDAVTSFLSQASEMSPTPSFRLLGLLGLLFNLAVMYLLLSSGWPVIAASLIGALFGSFLPFIGVDYRVSRGDFKGYCIVNGIAFRIIRFYMCMAPVVLTIVAVMGLFYWVFKINPLLAQFIGIIVGFFVNVIVSPERIWECRARS